MLKRIGAIRDRMEQMTIRIPADDKAEIESDAEEAGVSASEHVRTLIRRGREYERIAEERDRLERRVAALIEDREERTELVRYVEDEQEWRRAPLSQRIKWWIRGMED